MYLKAELLRQSILKKAFSGKLVPQDPSDDIASELLALTQAEKAAQKTVAKSNTVGNAGANRSKKNKGTANG